MKRENERLRGIVGHLLDMPSTCTVGDFEQEIVDRSLRLGDEAVAYTRAYNAAVVRSANSTGGESDHGRASLEALQADRPDLMAITHIEDLRYLVRRFSHETGVRVGSYETIEDTTCQLVGAMMSIKATQERTTRALSG